MKTVPEPNAELLSAEDVHGDVAPQNLDRLIVVLTDAKHHAASAVRLDLTNGVQHLVEVERDRNNLPGTQPYPLTIHPFGGSLLLSPAQSAQRLAG